MTMVGARPMVDNLGRIGQTSYAFRSRTMVNAGLGNDLHIQQ
jgi:hypothetical protein